MQQIKASLVVPGVVDKNTPLNFIDYLLNEAYLDHDCKRINYKDPKPTHERPFVPDESKEFSALLSCTGFLIVTRSNYAMPCPSCSPCYKRYGDLEAGLPGNCKGSFTKYAFTLPPDIWGKEIPTLMKVIF